MSTDVEKFDAHEESDTDAVGPFSTPPRSIVDADGRTIRLRGADESSDERASLAAMYDEFGTADRAQGIPPAAPRRREAWLDRIAEGLAVVATHDGRAVGHGVLLDGDEDHELALFVHPGYRSAGIGSAVLRTLLGHGRSAGIERVWLSVQRTNRAAVHLYRTVGFRPTGTAGQMKAALEMTLSLR
ncbi:GNAT family N-acetyltransferase [Halorussus litoreus]|uniref:GNAT family N-acetyltransferase n=1 Tax=Halorussus litoreus TaxID=1710536 RepID=UPI000E22C045|nr:GNAT family N-acetyltransferase [Halorussus litoreus]